MGKKKWFHQESARNSHFNAFITRIEVVSAALKKRGRKMYVLFKIFRGFRFKELMGSQAKTISARIHIWLFLADEKLSDSLGM